MNYDFLVGLIIGIAFTIMLLIIMGMLYAAGKADEESDVYYQQHLEASISKREREKEKMRQKNYSSEEAVLSEEPILYCESPGCNNELVHRQEMLWGKCDSCMFP